MSMKAFEAQYTAWLDGTLAGSELAEFEAALSKQLGCSAICAKQSAEEDRAEAQKLGDLLRAHSEPRELKNADFFNHRLLQEIERESPSPNNGGSQNSWPFWRMIWAGSFSLGVAAVMFFAVVLPDLRPALPANAYFAQILETKAGDPAISAVAYHDAKENVTVLWLDGLDYVKADPAQKE